MKLLTAGASAVLAAIVATGCGGAGKPDIERGETADLVAAQTAARERLDAATRAAKPGTPEHTLLVFWKSAHQRLYVPAAQVYDERVRNGLGVRVITGGLDMQRDTFRYSSPRVAAREGTGGSRSLTVQLEGGGAEREVTYLMRRRGTRWQIVYDTVLDDGLFEYGRLRVRVGVGGKTQKDADAAGRALVERYRLLTPSVGRGA